MSKFNRAYPIVSFESAAMTWISRAIFRILTDLKCACSKRRSVPT